MRAIRCGAEAMKVELSIDRMPSEMVHLIEGNLDQIVGVVDVTVEYRSSAPQL